MTDRPGDIELLAHLMSYTIPKDDAQPLAARLYDYHGSIAPLLEALPMDLMRIPGMKRRAEDIVTLIPQLTRFIALEQMKDISRVDTFSRSSEYLLRMYIGARTEACHLLSMDKAGKRIDCGVVQEGMIDEIPFNMRRIVEMAVRAKAHAVILSHNHPNGTMYPSRQDLDCTLWAIQTLRPMDICLLDHIVVADGTAISIRRHSAELDEAFCSQNKFDKQLRNWYKT